MVKGSTELIKPGDYLPALASADALRTIEEDLGGEKISAFDLPIWKVAPGGTGQFDNGTDSQKTVTGVIIGQSLKRAYWENPLGDDGAQTGQTPDCSSVDGITGRGNNGPAVSPTGKCADCPMAEFGSAKKGKGQGCKSRRLVFLMTGGDNVLPSIVSLPPTSLKAWRKYIVGDLNGKPYESVVTELSQEKKTNGKNTYGVVRLRRAADLAPEDAARARAYRDQFAPMVKAQAAAASFADGADADEAEWERQGQMAAAVESESE